MDYITGKGRKPLLTRHPMTATRPGQSSGNAPGVLAGRLAAELTRHEPGWRLPRISELARRYNASPEQMEAAVAEMASRHLVRELRDGQVYRASPAEYLTTFEALPGLGSVIDPMGVAVTCTEQRVQRQPVPDDVRRALRFLPGAEACSVWRLWKAGRCPAAVSITYLPAYLAGLLDPASARPGIGVILTPPPAAMAGLPPARPCAFYLEVQPPARAVARRLRLREGDPAIMMTVTFEDPGTALPFAMTAAVLRPNLFRIAVEAATAHESGSAIPRDPP